MKIEGPNFGAYDRQFMQVVRQVGATPVRPNLFREVDDQVALALLLTDAVDLSPEAKRLLNELKKQMAGGQSLAQALEHDQDGVIYSFKQLRELVYGKPDEGKSQSPGQGAEAADQATPRWQPPSIQISRRSPEQRRKTVSAAAGIAKAMIVHSPTAYLRDTLAGELAVMGERILSVCKGFGVRILVLERNQPLSALRLANMSVVAPGEKTFDGRPWDQVRGLYDNSRRILVLGEEQVGVPSNSTGRHELAHAYDHAFSEQHRRTLPLSVQLWNLFAGSRIGFVSEYAGSKPAEYFAESVEAFFRAAGRTLLGARDPQMLQYLETLFAV